MSNLHSQFITRRVPNARNQPGYRQLRVAVVVYGAFRLRAPILTSYAEIEQWMSAPAEEALQLQKPLAHGVLKVVAAGERKDEVA
jgi:hypothetical protein